MIPINISTQHTIGSIIQYKQSFKLFCYSPTRNVW